jgi:hypothetical protein
MTLMAIRDDAGTRALRLAALKGIHRVVIAGLVVIIASGVLMFGADVDMFLYSKAFWLKMGLMLLLMANGVVLVRAERRVEHGDQAAWSQLKLTATASQLTTDDPVPTTPAKAPARGASFCRRLVGASLSHCWGWGCRPATYWRSRCS